MDVTKHTKGPWQVVGEVNPFIYSEVARDTIAKIIPGKADGVVDANAALIAQAPTLLAQNKALVEALEIIAGQAGHRLAFYESLAASVLARVREEAYR